MLDLDHIQQIEKLCPICEVNNASHEHHIIFREMTFNGVKGIDGPTVFLCPNCHTNIHLTAASIASKNPKKKTYLNESQMARAHKYIQVLAVLIVQSKTEKSVGQKVKSMVHFSFTEMELLHLIQKDKGYTRADEFIHDIVVAYLNSQL